MRYRRPHVRSPGEPGPFARLIAPVYPWRDVADTPEQGGPPRAGSASGVASASAESRAVSPRTLDGEGDAADSEQFAAAERYTPTPATGTPRPSLKRRVTRPSFLIDLTAGSPVGEYEVQSQIGEGAMGTVFYAVHPLIGKKAAIKVLKPELCANQAQIDRFVQEAQAVNKIGHPNIVDVFSFGELADGRVYMVMEWLRGEDLKTRLAHGPMPVADACTILEGIARALEAAHAQDIVHRDLKPDNVFLHQVENGPQIVKLLDFGIAKLVRVTPGTERTQTGNMLGTPRYISPEQARGVNVDRRADIYSLGVMAFEMLAGRPPFEGETAMDLVVKHLNEPPPKLSDFARVPKALEACVMSMLEKSADKRPPLDRVRAVFADPSQRGTPLPLPAPRRFPLAAVVVVAAIAIGGVTWKLVAGAKHEEPAVAAGSGSPTPTPVQTPTPDQAPKRANVEIDVSGATDAIILIDGVEKGRGVQLKAELEPGPHDIEVRAPGRGQIPPSHVELAANETNTLSFSFSAATAPVAHPTGGHLPHHDQPKPDPRPKPDDDELLTPHKH